MSGAAASGPSGSSVTLRATFGAVQAADDGWQRSLDLREKFNDAEEDVREATDKHIKAGHAAAVAKRKASRMAQLLRWMQQEDFGPGGWRRR